MSAETIFIVDDDDIYRFTIGKTIETAKIPVKPLMFSDGEEAYSFLTENISNTSALPDVILLDINMPAMDGWEFMKRYTQLKPQLNKNITIYMVSSSISELDINRAKKNPEISGYISKPLTLEKFKTFVLKDLN